MNIVYKDLPLFRGDENVGKTKVKKYDDCMSVASG
jgi:hypothetical protein